MDDDLPKLDLNKALAQLATEPNPYITLFQRQDARVLLFAPSGEDTQTPHNQDEIYIVIRGTGTFRRGDETISFGPGDVLLAAAHVPHSFETFSADFATWVVFFGARI